MDREELHRRFTYHPPSAEQTVLYEEIRSRALELASFIVDVAPRNREQSLAITHLEQAVMWANASIARGEVKA
jgi:hypothetical protein